MFFGQNDPKQEIDGFLAEKKFQHKSNMLRRGFDFLVFRKMTPKKVKKWLFFLFFPFDLSRSKLNTYFLKKLQSSVIRQLIQFWVDSMHLQAFLIKIKRLIFRSIFSQMVAKNHKLKKSGKKKQFFWESSPLLNSYQNRSIGCFPILIRCRMCV